MSDVLAHDIILTLPIGLVYDVVPVADTRAKSSRGIWQTLYSVLKDILCRDFLYSIQFATGGVILPFDQMMAVPIYGRYRPRYKDYLWSPHSLVDSFSHHHRPFRMSSLDVTGLVQGSHPILI